jgi:hypothetical protein
MYTHLSEDRRIAFKGYQIGFITILLKTPRDVVFLSYEDINSGGVDLSSQQLRRAAYCSPFIDKLDKLVENKDFKAMRKTDGQAKDKDGKRRTTKTTIMK